MRLLYLVSKGMDDPTLASVPLHIAANGSLEVGQGMYPWSSLGTQRTWSLETTPNAWRVSGCLLRASC